MTQITYTRAILITGKNERGNEYAYTKDHEGGWYDLLNECPITARYIANVIVPSVVKARFGNYEMTREEWELNGCPFELTDEQMRVLPGLQDAFAEPQAPEAEQIEHEILRDDEWLVDVKADHADWQDWQQTRESGYPR